MTVEEWLEGAGEFVGENVIGPAVAGALERPDVQAQLTDAAARAVETEAVQKTVLQAAFVLGGSILGAIVLARLIREL